MYLKQTNSASGERRFRREAFEIETINRLFLWRKKE